MTAVQHDGVRATGIEPATRTLARFASELHFDGVPPDVAEAAKTLLLDCLGCTLYASTLPWSVIVQDYVGAEDARAVAGVWGTSLATSPSLAALANGTAGHGFEIDEVDHRSGLHVTSVTVPVVLALAEAGGGMSGSDFLAAVIAGIEVGVRVGIAIAPGHFCAATTRRARSARSQRPRRRPVLSGSTTRGRRTRSASPRAWPAG